MALTERQDALGRGFLDTFETGVNACITIERDDGHAEVGMECGPYFEPYEQWGELGRRAMDFVRGRVLDVGCGPGRHAVYLQGKGHQVVGIDESPLAIEVCRRRGLKDARVMRFTQIGSELGVFDTILMLGNNFGLFANAKRARWMLKRLHRLTSPEARIVAESRDPYHTSNPLHLAYHERNRRRGRMGGQIRMRAIYGDYVTPWFEYLLVSREEMVELLSGTGWDLREVVESDGSGYLAVIVKDGGFGSG